MWIETTEEVDFEAPCAAAWALRRDFLRLPEYNPDVSEIEQLADDRYRFLLSTPVGPHQVELVVTESEKDSSVTAAIFGLLAATETFSVSALPEGRSHAVLSLRLDVPGEGYEENARRQIRAELDAMAILLAL